MLGPEEFICGKSKPIPRDNQQVTAIYKRSWENETGTEDKFTLNVEVV